MKSLVPVADVESLPPGNARTVEVRGRRIALANVDGRFFAVADRCPHRAGPLGAGYLDGQVLHCPLHGWGFDVTTGACDVRPDQPVACHRVEVRDGQVWLEFEEG
ncbi:MAG: Rieske 2Fe-2S domain-containing protein [Verrucomicrobia bacterium]|nr:Rieske 2Fe-2S domain-containing protein [Verrucomicrobiota bacterium]